MPTETKTRAACRSEIHPEACLCAHCRSPQGYRGYLIYALVVLPIVILLILSAWTRSRVAETFDPPKYSSYPGALTVTDSENRFFRRKRQLSGRRYNVRNDRERERYSWKELQLRSEVSSIARAVSLTRVRSTALDTFIPARGQGAFRLRIAPARVLDAYAKLEVIVHYARFGAGRW